MRKRVEKRLGARGGFGEWGGGGGEEEGTASTSSRTCDLCAAVPNLGSIPAFAADIVSGSCHTSDLKLGTPVATLPGVWRHRVSTGTGWPGVSIL